MAKIIAFRHGQTTDNRDNRFSGWANPDLTTQGIQEAKTIQEKLKNEPITKAYASDLLRSQHTLSLVLETYHEGITPLIDPRIKERDYGDLTGKSKIQIAKQHPEEYKLWHRSYTTPPPNGESIAMVEKRVLAFLSDMMPALQPSDVVVISAHGNSLRPLRRYFEHLSVDEMCSFEHTPAAIYTYTI